MSAPGDLCDQPLHLCPSSTIEHPRRVLKVHPANVDPLLLHQADTKPDHLFIRGKIVAPEHGIGADLPDDQIGVLGDDISVETHQLLPDVLAADPMIDDLYLDVGKPVLQLLLEPAWIAHRRGARPDTLCRG